jgi:hypothetical protein
LDLNVIGIFISIIIYIYFGYWLKSSFKNYNVNDYFILIILISTLNVILILVEFFFPGVQYFIEFINYQNPDSNIDYAIHYFKMRGIAYGGGASLSIFTAISALFIFKYSNKIGVLFSFLLLLIYIGSTFFIGRTGLGIIIIIFLFYLITSFSLKNMFYIFLLLFGIEYFLVDFILNFIKNDFVIEYSTNWINSILAGENIEDPSSVAFREMVHFPNDILTSFFGNGYFFNTLSNKHTDSGIIKLIYCFGFVLSFLIYFLIFKVTWKAYKYYKDPYIIIFFSILLFCEIKEPILFTNYSSRMFFLFIGIYCYDKKG